MYTLYTLYSEDIRGWYLTDRVSVSDWPQAHTEADKIKQAEGVKQTFDSKDDQRIKQLIFENYFWLLK